MNLLLPPKPDCESCDLHQSATNPGIPFRPRVDNEHPRDKALLIIGEAPGYEEDKVGQSWVGRAGQLLNKFVDAVDFDSLADVYLGNACRCRPSQNDSPTKKQIDSCRPYLLQDILKLSEHYDEVVVFACGASAVKSITNNEHSIKSATSKQGAAMHTFNLPVPPNVTTFFTYHPAVLMPGRKPALVGAVESHFLLVVRYLKGEITPNELPFTHHIGDPVPKNLPQLVARHPIVSIDIETYGILKGQDQTVFHPAKAEHIDNISPEHQIVSVAFAFQAGNDYYAYSYVWSNPHHRVQIRKWIETCIHHKIPLLGQNIPFDISFMKRCDKILSYLIKPYKLTLDDTLILSFLWYEQRPERGLKELSKLLSIFNYDSLTFTAKTGRAKSPEDPALHKYNAIDAVATLMLRHRLLSSIKSKYGSTSPKLTETCRSFRNQALWDVITMQLAGVVLDKQKLMAYHKELIKTVGHLSSELYRECGVITGGKGSDKSKRTFLSNLLERYGLTDDPRILYTEKTQQLSLKIENLEVAKSHCPPKSSDFHHLDMMIRYSHLSKLITSYTKPLLEEPRRGIVINKTPKKGICWPSWYVTPRPQSKISSDDEGGTIQARFSCKNPGAQTFPKQIKRSFISRYVGGRIVFWDYSQMELRIAALLSGDEPMLDDYREGRDLHAKTALDSIPGADVNSDDWSNQRYLGKTINFLILYLGGGKKLQETAYQNLGINLDIGTCYQIIDNFNRAHPQMRAWQDDLLNEAKTKGYVELLTGWSRSYSLGQGAVDSYRNEICNHPVQTLAAQVVQSAQFSVICELQKRRMRTVPFIQVHDSIGFDVPENEVEKLPGIVEKCLLSPPLYDTITEYLGRAIPLEIERENW